MEYSVLPRITLALVLGAVVLFIYYVSQISHFIRQRRKIMKAAAQFDGPKKHWLFGNVHQLPRQVENIRGWIHHWGCARKSFVGWIGPVTPLIIVTHPDTAKTVFKTESIKPRSWDGIYHMFESWFPKALMMSSGPRWRRHRKRLTSLFHFEAVKSYMAVYNHSAKSFVTRAQQQTAAAAAARGREAGGGGDFRDVFEPLCQLTTEELMKCVFSSDQDVQAQPEAHPYTASLGTLQDMIVTRVTKPYLLLDPLFFLLPIGRQWRRVVATMRGVCESIMDERQAEYKVDSSSQGETARKEKARVLPDGKDFLDVLLTGDDENGEPYPRDEIADMIDGFFLGGVETSAVSLSYLLYNLATHPACQRRVQDEVDALMDAKAEGEEVSINDLTHVPYLANCLKESMRMYTPVPFVVRETTSDMELDGRAVPAGSQVCVMMDAIHHHPDVWGPDHNEFKPERFDVSGMDPFAFVPFSAGKRNCIGQNFAEKEMKTFMVWVMRNFSVVADPENPPKPVVQMTLRSKNGVRIQFVPRDRVNPSTAM